MADDPTIPGETRRKGSAAKAFRTELIIGKAMAGETVTQIAEDVGLCRQTVSEILNSEEVENRVKEIRSRLAEGIYDAIETVLRSARLEYVPARDLLRNFGAMAAKLEVSEDRENRGLAQVLGEARKRRERAEIEEARSAGYSTPGEMQQAFKEWSEEKRRLKPVFEEMKKDIQKRLDEEAQADGYANYDERQDAFKKWTLEQRNLKARN